MKKKHTIVILHDSHEWLNKIIFKDFNYFVVPVYPEKGWCSFRLLDFYILVKILLLNLFNKNLLHCKGDWKFLYDYFLLAKIKSINPISVLTHIDNSYFFQRISMLDRERDYYAIQNSIRTFNDVAKVNNKYSSDPKKISITNYFCFGQKEKDLFTFWGHDISNFYYMGGSLPAGYYRSTLDAGIVEKKYDLCLISQWIDSNFSGLNTSKAAQESRDANLVLIKLLSLLIIKNNYKVIVCLRGNSAKERLFYIDHFGLNVEFMNSDRESFSTYYGVMLSRLTIAVCSTVLIDALSWGEKVLWCNTINCKNYFMDIPSDLYFYGDNFELFNLKVEKILEQPLEDFQAKNLEISKYMAPFSALNPPHKIVVETLLNNIALKISNSSF